MSHIIKLILLVVVVLFILSFFGISLQSIIESPAGQANIAFVWGYVLIGWEWLWGFIKDVINFIIFWD